MLRSSYENRHRTLALTLALITGLIAIYGLGHLYLRKTRRGLALLASAALPLGLLIPTILWPQAFPFFIATSAWFILFVWQSWDLLNLARRLP